MESWPYTEVSLRKMKIMKKVFYDSNPDLVQSYSKEITESSSNLFKAALLDKYKENIKKILDLGCANGLFLKVFKDKVSYIEEMTSVDLSEEMLTEASNFARELGFNSNANFLKLDITESNQVLRQDYQLVYCFSTIQMSGKLGEILENVYEYVDHQGIVILDIPGKWNLSFWFWKRYYRFRGLDNFYAYSIGEINQILFKSKFNIVEWHSSGLLDQYQYIPLIRRFKMINKFIHNGSPLLDFDHYCSNIKLMRQFANRHYIVFRRS